MKQHARELQFEKAQQLKEEIDLIKEFVLESYISSPQKVDYDVVALHTTGRNTFIIHFSIIAGIVKKKNYYSFATIQGIKEDILRNFLISYYKNHNIPKEIIAPYYPTDYSHLEELFTKMKKLKVQIKIPQRGNKKKLLDLAQRNLNIYKTKNEFHDLSKKIKSALKLKNIPCLVEGYDISHLGERERVGAVVVFNNGKPLKSQYRNYIIKKADAGDIDALKEVLERRLKKITQHPDLMVIDGGKAQLNIAKKIKSKLNITSDIIAIAKREERIFQENGNSVVFPDDSPEMFFFQNIRDEAHRRAISHHRKKREKIPSQ
jgi:excinuclease ABC subunit C